MATPSQVLDEMSQTLLCCKICEEPFDQQVRLPRVLPCHHTFCGTCIARLDRGGNLQCPNCREDIQVTGPFPVDTTRGALLDLTQVFRTAGQAGCQGCEDGGPATWRCVDCAQTLCQDCHAAHQRVKTARDHVMVSLEEAARSPSLLLPKAEMCQQHPDEKLKFFCSTCDSAVCSTCVVVLHRDRDGHDHAELGGVLEQARREIETLCVDLDHIRESILQPRAKMAAASLQEGDAAFQSAARALEDVFSQAAHVLLERKGRALEELSSRWKAERLALEEQAAVTEGQTSGAQTSTALGRTVASVGLPTHVLAQRQQLQRAVLQARAEGDRPLLCWPRYTVDTDLSGLGQAVQRLGTVLADTPQSPQSKAADQQTEGETSGKADSRGERKAVRQRAVKPVTSPSTSVPMSSSETSAVSSSETTSAVSSSETSAVSSSETSAVSSSETSAVSSSETSSIILTPEFLLEEGRCRDGCCVYFGGKALDNDRRTKYPATGRQPFAFLGTCGSVDLAQPALHYWTVRCHVRNTYPGDCCEVGLASLQTLDTCGGDHRLSDHDVNAATLLVVRDGGSLRLEGRGWTPDLQSPPNPDGPHSTYTCLESCDGRNFEMTLGFLYDNRQPQSPCVLVVEVESCRLLGVRRLSPSPPLRPVCRLWPPRNKSWNWDVVLTVGTGPGILRDVTASKLQSLLGQLGR